MPSRLAPQAMQCRLVAGQVPPHAGHVFTSLASASVPACSGFCSSIFSSLCQSLLVIHDYAINTAACCLARNGSSATHPTGRHSTLRAKSLAVSYHISLLDTTSWKRPRWESHCRLVSLPEIPGTRCTTLPARHLLSSGCASCLRSFRPRLCIAGLPVLVNSSTSTVT
jgi:hypothetical protein